MSEIYRKGDAVVYDVYGVCEVKGIERMSFTPSQEKEEFSFSLGIDKEEVSKYIKNALKAEWLKCRIYLCKIHIVTSAADLYNIIENIKAKGGVLHEEKGYHRKPSVRFGRKKHR